MKVKNKRKLWKATAIYTNISFKNNFTACPNIVFEKSACQKSDQLLN